LSCPIVVLCHMSCPDFLATVITSWLSYLSCPVLAVMFWSSCPPVLSSLPHRTIPTVFSGCPVLATVFWLSCPSFVPSSPVPPVLSLTLCPDRPVLSFVQADLSGPIPTDLSILSVPMSCTKCPIATVSCHSCL
jgi:hypothetical protein